MWQHQETDKNDQKKEKKSCVEKAKEALATTTTTTNFIENWKITNYITFPPANSL